MNVSAIHRGRFSVKSKAAEFDESSKTVAKKKNPVPRSRERDRWASCRPKARHCAGLVIVTEVFTNTGGESQANRIGARELS
jgi:hypothetical protein